MQLYTAQFVLPISAPTIENGAIAVENGAIVAVGTRQELKAQYPKAPVEDLEGCVLMPGLVNAHSHLALTLFEASPPPEHFVDWIIGQQSYIAKQAPISKRAALMKGIEEAIASGTTCLGDVGMHDEHIQTIENSHLRFVLFPELASLSQEHMQNHYETALGFIDSLQQKSDSRLSAGLAPYSPYLLSRNLLKIIHQHAAEQKLPLKIHAAESFAEMEFFFDSKGEIANILFPHVGWKDELPPPHCKTPIQFLESIGFLKNNPSLIGCIHLGESDLSVLVKRDVRVIHCPRTENFLQLGKAPVKKLTECGVTVALGTDGMGKNGSLSLWDEMRFAHEYHGQRAKDSLSYDSLLKMCTLNAAQALGQESKIGSLEVGKKADFIIIHPQGTLLKKNSLAQSLIENITPRWIQKVYVEGEELT